MKPAPCEHCGATYHQPWDDGLVECRNNLRDELELMRVTLAEERAARKLDALGLQTVAAKLAAAEAERDRLLAWQREHFPRVTKGDVSGLAATLDDMAEIDDKLRDLRAKNGIPCERCAAAEARASAAERETERRIVEALVGLSDQYADGDMVEQCDFTAEGIAIGVEFIRSGKWKKGGG